MSIMENRDMQQDLPLSGVRVIDFTQVMMGPVCTQTLGDYGADVIKIERKGAGDLSRSTFEPVAGADNPIFCSLNRNKRSVALDLRDPTHMAQVKALIAGADVVVNNFRAGVMERMGLGYDDCKALNRASSTRSAPAMAKPAPTHSRAARTCWPRRYPA